MDYLQGRKTPLFDQHVAGGAKMINFSGWLLPLEYMGGLYEAKAARAGSVLFDASHMGQISVSGGKAADFLQRLTSNDISLINSLQLQYNLFISPRGTILDDFILYRVNGSFLSVVNACNKEKVIAWLEKNKTRGVVIRDESDHTALLSLQGPRSQELLEEVSGVSLRSLPYMNFVNVSFEGSRCFISRSGYTGEKGYEIYCEADFAPFLWDKLVKKGVDYSLVPAGLSSRDILRIEAGYPLYGNDIDEDTNPWEASLGWVVKDKGVDFIGRKAVAEAKEERPKRMRIGFIMDDRAMPRKGYLLYNSGTPVGEVTSAAYSPNMNKFIGMAYVAAEYSKIDTVLHLAVRNKFYRCYVARFPFVKIRANK
ncbi:MAG: glycine cleavage system aminomethyltransferase GcvT [Candidatus Omnitrophota bacterium]